MRENIDKYVCDVDFSGTIAPLKYVRQYFYTHERERYGAPLEDIRFMKYLDGIGMTTPSTPFIFRRVIGDTSKWREDLANEIESLVKQIRYLQQQKDKLQTNL